MTGEIVLFDKNINEGVIKGVDKQYYDFHIGEWLESLRIKIGQEVRYDVVENEARNIVLNIKKPIQNVLHIQIELLFSK